jgi:arylsulfatase A
VQESDWAEWQFEVPGPGKFEVEILQGCGGGSGGAEIEISLDGSWLLGQTVAAQIIKAKVEETGHFQRFVPLRIGTLRLDKTGRHTLVLRAKTKPGPAVMDVRRITLRAAH